MQYIISNIKRSLFVLFITLLTISISTSSSYAGTAAAVRRGDTANISWNVSNASCSASTNYSSANDNIALDWSGSKSGTGSQGFAKVTAVPGTYTFYCTVPNGVGGCTGVPGVGAQNTCWDSAVLTVNDCLGGFVWVAASQSCVAQSCTPDTRFSSGCTQNVDNGTMTIMCNSSGTGTVGSCELTSCSGGGIVSGGTCVCPSGQHYDTGVCVDDIICTPGDVRVPPVCPQTDPHGTVSQICDTGGTGWGSCQLTACNSGYINVGGVCKAPSGNFTSTPGCEIKAGEASCYTTLEWNLQNGSFILEDCGGGLYTGVGEGVGSGLVHVPYGVGCYRIVETSGTGFVMSTGSTIQSVCEAGSAWSVSDNKCMANLFINASNSSRYYGEPYTFNWTTNASNVSVSHGGDLLGTVAGSANGYTISGNSGEPSLASTANSLIFNLLGNTVGLGNVSKAVSVGLLYKAKSNIGTATNNNGSVSIPISCSYATSYALVNNSNGLVLKSASGLNKALVTSDEYICPLALCPTDVSLTCNSDVDDTITTEIDLSALRAHVINFSVTPSAVEKNSVNNKIALSWSVSSLDNCYVSVKAESTAAEDISEASLLNSMVRANVNINPLPTLKSKDVAVGSNVITGVNIKYPKLFILACGDLDKDGVPEGIYAPDPTSLKRARLNITNTKEQ